MCWRSEGLYCISCVCLCVYFSSIWTQIRTAALIASNAAAKLWTCLSMCRSTCNILITVSVSDCPAGPYGGDYFLVRENFGRMFDHFLPLLFFLAFFFFCLGGGGRLIRTHLIPRCMPGWVHRELRRLWPNVPWQVACELVSEWIPTQWLDSGTVSPLRQSLIKGVYACLVVTCHLHFWQNDRFIFYVPLR